MDDRPIGIFDSGIGGLSMWSSLVRILPHESMYYVGDNLYNPYSEKPRAFIQKRAKAITSFLVGKKAKVIIVACNTATVTSIDYLRSMFPDIPIVGVVPVIKTASQKTKTHTYAILSTVRTAKSAYQKHLVRTFAPNDTVIPIATTRLVEYIEKGDVDSPKLRSHLESLFVPYKTSIDVLVLGCTHFPLVRETIRDVVGRNVLLMDSSDPVARQVKRILDHNGIAMKRNTLPSHRLFTTGDAFSVGRVVSRLVPGLPVVEHVDIF